MTKRGSTFDMRNSLVMLGEDFYLTAESPPGPGGGKRTKLCQINALLSYLKEMTFNLQAGVRLGELSIFYFQFLLVCHVMTCH